MHWISAFTCWNSAEIHHLWWISVLKRRNVLHFLKSTSVGCGFQLNWWSISKVRCLRLTVNSKWITLIFRFSWKSTQIQPQFTVWCSHLTVNSQWKTLIFTPKRSFGVKTGILQLFSWFPATFLVYSCKAATIFTKYSHGPCYFGEVNWRCFDGTTTYVVVQVIHIW